MLSRDRASAGRAGRRARPRPAATPTCLPCAGAPPPPPIDPLIEPHLANFFFFWGPSCVECGCSRLPLTEAHGSADGVLSDASSELAAGRLSLGTAPGSDRESERERAQRDAGGEEGGSPERFFPSLPVRLNPELVGFGGDLEVVVAAVGRTTGPDRQEWSEPPPRRTRRKQARAAPSPLRSIFSGGVLRSARKREEAWKGILLFSTTGTRVPAMSEFWHKIGCCVVEKPQPVRFSYPGSLNPASFILEEAPPPHRHPGSKVGSPDFPGCGLLAAFAPAWS
nr:PREDICTED: CDC42 small effector protein 1 [Lepisosteus oculatus]